MNYQELDTLKARLDGHRPLSDSIVKNLHDDLVVRWTYHSNAIEGNTLTLQETKVVLEGITIGGKALREHFEAINHKEAILFIEDLVSANEALCEVSIREIHSLILKNIDEENAGKYRQTNVMISGASHRPPQFFDVPQQMQSLMDWYQSHHQTLHPVELAARVHIDFVKIHPFIDGNGRTARLLMNLELLKQGFPPVVILMEDRLTYYQSLDEAHTSQNDQPFMELMEKLVKQSFEPYFYLLGNTK